MTVKSKTPDIDWVKYDARKKEFWNNFEYSVRKANSDFNETSIAKKAKQEGWWEDRGLFNRGLKFVTEEIIKLQAYTLLCNSYKDIDLPGIGLHSDLNSFSYKENPLNNYLLSYEFKNKVARRGTISTELPSELLEKIKKKILGVKIKREINPEFKKALEMVLNSNKKKKKHE